jgi:hypothetical protein
MGREGKPVKRLMSIFGGACTGLKAGVNEKGLAVVTARRAGSRSIKSFDFARDDSLFLHQFQYRRGHRHNSGANRWFRHGRKFA